MRLCPNVCPAPQVFLCWCLLLISPVQAERLGTVELVRAAADRDCLAYRVRGVCLWLNCGPGGCRVRSSPRIGHYLPDAVVLVYSEQSPWEVERLLHEPLMRAQKLGGGGWGVGDHGMRFYRAAVIGSPALSAMERSHVLPLCPSAAHPNRAYFLSAADSMRWRFAPFTGLVSPANLRRRIGAGDDVWGPLFPRHGFIVQAHAHKAAAVIAQRAADIVVNKGQKRVYRYLGSECGRGCSGPPALRENSAVGGYWQALHPKRAGCGVFATASSAPVLRGDGTEAYAWHLWRPYQCCKPMGQVLLRVLEWESGEGA